MNEKCSILQSKTLQLIGPSISKRAKLGLYKKINTERSSFKLGRSFSPLLSLLPQFSDLESEVEHQGHEDQVQEGQGDHCWISGLLQNFEQAAIAKEKSLCVLKYEQIYNYPRLYFF